MKRKKNKMNCYICGRKATKIRNIGGIDMPLCKYHNVKNIGVLDVSTRV